MIRARSQAAGPTSGPAWIGCCIGPGRPWSRSPIGCAPVSGPKRRLHRPPNLPWQPCVLLFEPPIEGDPMTEQSLPPGTPAHPDPGAFQARVTRTLYQEDPRMRSVALATLLSVMPGLGQV